MIIPEVIDAALGAVPNFISMLADDELRFANIENEYRASACKLSE
jgi:hypothetical protein